MAFLIRFALFLGALVLLAYGLIRGGEALTGDSPLPVPPPEVFVACIAGMILLVSAMCYRYQGYQVHYMNCVGTRVGGLLIGFFLTGLSAQAFGLAGWLLPGMSILGAFLGYSLVASATVPVMRRQEEE